MVSKIANRTLAAAAAAACLLHGPQYARDTLDYVSGSIARPPLPCLIFSGLRAIFGAHYGWVYMLCQMAAVIAAARYFSAALRRLSKSGEFAQTLFFAVALSPLVTVWLGCTLLTEAFSYALFLVAFALLAGLAEEFSERGFVLLAAAVALNILNRPQMLFMYFVYVPAALWLLHRAGKKAAHIILWLALPLVCAYGLECCGNLAVHGKFTRSDFAGRVQTASSLLYVSSPEDLRLFADKPYYPAMRKVFAEMDAYRLNARYRYDMDMNYAAYLDSGIRPIGIYSDRSSRSDILYWHTLVRNLYMFERHSVISREDWGSARAVDYSDTATWLAVRADAGGITRTLLALRWEEYLKLCGSKLRNHVPVYCAALLLLFFAMPLLRPGPVAEFMNLSVVAFACNLALIAACTGILPRLTVYTDALFMECALLLAVELRGRA